MGKKLMFYICERHQAIRDIKAGSALRIHSHPAKRIHSHPDVTKATFADAGANI